MLMLLLLVFVLFCESSVCLIIHAYLEFLWIKRESDLSRKKITWGQMYTQKKIETWQNESLRIEEKICITLLCTDGRMQITRLRERERRWLREKCFFDCFETTNSEKISTHAEISLYTCWNFFAEISLIYLEIVCEVPNENIRKTDL